MAARSVTNANPSPEIGPRRLLYIADPMCSWCWGFAPVIADIADRIAGRAGLRVVVGGLRVGVAQAMTERDKAYVRRHWEQVAAETGQPFTFAFFERAAFVYDTGPACRAVVAVRSLAPDTTAGYLRAVQHAFYVDNRDTTDLAVLGELASGFGIAPVDFMTVFGAEAVRAATHADFTLAPALGLGGFPSVVLSNAGQLTLLTEGYQPLAALAPALEQWLDG